MQRRPDLRFAIAALLWMLACGDGYAQADYGREARWAGEIAAGLVVGEPVALALPGGRKFLAIHAANPRARAAIIVVHGVGVHPDWGLINVLRTELHERGYATLSVQMPVLAAAARGNEYPPLFPEAADRLAAATSYLHGAGFRHVAIVSHSMGSRMTDYFLARVREAPDAWVAIGLSGTFSAPQALRQPVLDLFGERDLPAVLGAAAQRATALRRARGSAQIEVPAADHFFAGREAELVRQVQRFLDDRIR